MGVNFKMGLKFVSILFLLVAAIYAAPAVEDEADDKMMDPTQLDEESLDALMEDDDEKEDPKMNVEPAKRTCPAVLKGKGFRQLIGYGQYCVCKAPQMSKKGDETEISEDDVTKHVESLAKDPKGYKKLTKQQKGKLFRDLTKGYFARSDKCCYCTYKKELVRLMAFLNKAKIMEKKAKMVFYYQFKKLVEAAVGKTKAFAYFKALMRG